MRPENGQHLNTKHHHSELSMAQAFSGECVDIDLCFKWKITDSKHTPLLLICSRSTATTKHSNHQFQRSMFKCASLHVLYILNHRAMWSCETSQAEAGLKG